MKVSRRRSLDFGRIWVSSCFSVEELSGCFVVIAVPSDSNLFLVLFCPYTDKRFVQQYVIRDYNTSKSSRDSVAAISSGAKNASQGRPPQRKDLSRRESDDACLPSTQNIEITESNHYDNLEEMGLPVPPSRRKTSLFDYGLKSD